MLRSSVNFKKLKKLNVGGVSLRNVEMKNYTTFRVGGKAKYYLEIHNLEGLIKVMLYLKEAQVKPFFLGNGSNILISDKGYSGVVISLKGNFDLIEQIDNQTIECGAGVLMSKVFAYARSLDLGGLEGGAGIPATVGGMVCMNASAYDFEMAKVVKYVIVFHEGKIKYFDNKDCCFGYRESIFQKGEYLIIRVGMQLISCNKNLVNDKFMTFMKKRQSSQPLEFPSAGCVFKRIDGLNISKMLDDGGFKGMKIGGAEVSKKHANFIINSGNATAQNIYNLINKIKNEFYQKYNVELQSEIQFLGEFDEITR